MDETKPKSYLENLFIQVANSVEFYDLDIVSLALRSFVFHAKLSISDIDLDLRA